LVDSGAVAKDDKGEWQLRERPAALEVPATLHGVVAARIDRLPPSARETIQLASVIGQRFGDRVLREAGGPRIADSVDELSVAEQARGLCEKLGRTDDAVKALYLIARVGRYRGENDAALSAYERALSMLEARDPNSDEVATVIAHMAELCTRWDAKYPDLEGLIARGLAIVDGKRNRERVLLLAARSFMSRRGPKANDAGLAAGLANGQGGLRHR